MKSVIQTTVAIYYRAVSPAGPFRFRLREAFPDPLIWGYAFLFHGFVFVLYTSSLFLVSLYNSFIHPF